MKRRILYSLIAVLMALPNLLEAQSIPTPAPVVYKDWTRLPEGAYEIEVEYRIIKCDATNQVHLFLFNENTTEKTAQLKVEITNNDTQEKVTKEISFTVSKLTMYKALCESDATLTPLKIDVPAGYDPNKITVTITLKA